MLGFVFGVEVVEVAEELVETVSRRQKLVAIAKVILAELSRHVAERLEQFRQRRIFVRQAFLSPWQPHLQETGAKWTLTGDKRCTAGGARLLAVVVGEDRV